MHLLKKEFKGKGKDVKGKEQEQGGFKSGSNCPCNDSNYTVCARKTPGMDLHNGHSQPRIVGTLHLTFSLRRMCEFKNSKNSSSSYPVIELLERRRMIVDA